MLFTDMNRYGRIIEHHPYIVAGGVFTLTVACTVSSIIWGKFPDFTDPQLVRNYTNMDAMVFHGKRLWKSIVNCEMSCSRLAWGGESEKEVIIDVGRGKFAFWQPNLDSFVIYSAMSCEKINPPAIFHTERTLAIDLKNSIKERVADLAPLKLAGRFSQQISLWLVGVPHPRGWTRLNLYIGLIINSTFLYT